MLLCVDTSQHPLRSVICVRPPAGANVTGGNLNPAVSFSQLVTCRVRRCLRSSIAPDITTSLLQMSVPKFAAYVIAQIGGAVVAAFLVQAVKPVGLDPLASSSLSLRVVSSELLLAAAWMEDTRHKTAHRPSRTSPRGKLASSKYSNHGRSFISNEAHAHSPDRSTISQPPRSAWAQDAQAR